jgi:hypothetical protein
MPRQVACSLIMAVVATGCFSSGEGDYQPSGTLVIDWTVDGSKDPQACRDFGVDRVSVVVRTRSGAFVEELLPLCERFETAIELVPTRYLVDAVLLDFERFELTTTVLANASVYDFEIAIVPVGFPRDSFL